MASEPSKSIMNGDQEDMEWISDDDYSSDGENEQSYSSLLNDDLTLRSTRASALMKALGLNYASFQNLTDESDKDLDIPIGFPIPLIDRAIERERNRSKNCKSKRGMVGIDAEEDKPVYNPTPALAALKYDLEKSLMNEAEVVILKANKNNSKQQKEIQSEEKPKSQSNATNGTKEHGNSTPRVRKVSKKILYELAYINALKRTVDGDSYAIKGGIPNLPSKALSYCLLQRQLETYNHHLKRTEKELLKKKEELERKIEREQLIKSELESLSNLVMKKLNTNDIGLDRSYAQIDPLKSESMSKLDDIINDAQETVNFLIGKLQKLIDNHISAVIFKKSINSLIVEPKSELNNGNIFPNGNEISLEKNIQPIEDNSDVEMIDKTTEENDLVVIDTSDEEPGIIKVSSKKTGSTTRVEIPPELFKTTNYKNQQEVATRLRIVILLLLNILLESSKNKTLYLKVPTLNDKIIQFLLDSNVVVQSSNDPLLISLRDFGSIHSH